MIIFFLSITIDFQPVIELVEMTKNFWNTNYFIH